MPLIAVSGTQGQGKSTVLASLSEMGFDVVVQKTSRQILADWGLSLPEVNKDPELKKKFQEECISRHHEYNEEAMSSDKIFFTERSYADIFVYTVLSIGPYNEYSEWLNSYYEKCKEGQRTYTSVIYLTGINGETKNDGVRSINQHFVNFVDMALQYYLKDFGTEVRNINSPNHQKRIELITEYLDTIIR